MLPDHPALKRRLSAFLTARMKSVHAVHAAPLGDLPFAHIQEGNKVMMVREDGSQEEIPMKHHRVTVRFTTEEVESLSTEDIHRKFDEAAREMAMKTGRTFIQSLDKAVTDVGNVFKYHGQLTPTTLMEMYEKVEIDFDDDGRPQLPTLMCGEKMFKEVSEVIPLIESDETLRQHFDMLMTKKRDQWSDREASRKLVG